MLLSRTASSSAKVARRGQSRAGAAKSKKLTSFVTAAAAAMASARSIKRSDEPPAHWPPDVKYLPNACQASPGLSAAHKTSYCQRLPWGSSLNPRRLELEGWCKVKPIKDESHPAYGQCGLFAAKDIPPRTAVIQYIGVVHTEAESDESSDYDLKVCAAGEEALGIDSSKAGNEARCKFVSEFCCSFSSSVLTKAVLLAL